MGKVRYKTAKVLVWLANKVIRSNSPLSTQFAQIDNHDFIDRKHLESLVEQGDDEKLSEFLDDSGWIAIADLKHEDGTPYTAQEAADMISKDLTLEADRKEQRELDKFYNGEQK